MPGRRARSIASVRVGVRKESFACVVFGCCMSTQSYEIFRTHTRLLKFFIPVLHGKGSDKDFSGAMLLYGSRKFGECAYLPPLVFVGKSA